MSETEARPPGSGAWMRTHPSDINAADDWNNFAHLVEHQPLCLNEGCEREHMHAFTDAELRAHEEHIISATCAALYEDTHPVSTWGVDLILEWSKYCAERASANPSSDPRDCDESDQ